MVVLIDTNILLDVIQERRPHAAAAVRIWALVKEGALAGFVSAISFNNVFYVARDNRRVVVSASSPSRGLVKP